MNTHLTAAEAQFLIRQMKGANWFCHYEHSMSPRCYYAITHDDLRNAESWMDLCIMILVEELEASCEPALYLTNES